MMNRQVFEKLNYGLYVIGTHAGGRDQGCLVSSFAQITSGTPRKCTVTVNKDNATCQALLESGTFALTMVDESCDEELVKRFGYKSGRVEEKFAAYDVQRDAAGNPYLTDGMAAWVSCRIVEKIEVGNFYLFLCDAVEGDVLSEGRVMTMDAFLKKGHFAAPPTATVYRTMRTDEGWVCPICGFVYEKDELPEGYICPLCRCPGEKFVKKQA